MTTILVIITLVAIESFCVFGLAGQWARGRGPMRRWPHADEARVRAARIQELEREMGL